MVGNPVEHHDGDICVGDNIFFRSDEPLGYKHLSIDTFKKSWLLPIVVQL